MSIAGSIERSSGKVTSAQPKVDTEISEWKRENKTTGGRTKRRLRTRKEGRKLNNACSKPRRRSTWLRFLDACLLHTENIRADGLAWPDYSALLSRTPWAGPTLIGPA